MLQFCLLILSALAKPHGAVNCASYGLEQDCAGNSDGACQMYCSSAICDGGKCDQRFSAKCKCDGGNCWQENCGPGSSCDGGHCSGSDDPPAGCISPSCKDTTTTDHPVNPTTNVTCVDYGLQQDCAGETDGACQIGCSVALCDGGKCDQRFSKSCRCDGGKCWQEGCDSLECDGGNCSTSGNAPDGCISYSCHGTTSTSGPPSPTPPGKKTCDDYGLPQDCDGETDGACQIQCDVAKCEGGKCDQRFSTYCKCDGGNCWQQGCQETACDGTHCSAGPTPPDGCICPSCKSP